MAARLLQFQGLQRPTHKTEKDGSTKAWQPHGRLLVEHYRTATHAHAAQVVMWNLYHFDIAARARSQRPAEASRGKRLRCLAPRPRHPLPQHPAKPDDLHVTTKAILLHCICSALRSRTRQERLRRASKLACFLQVCHIQSARRRKVGPARQKEASTQFHSAQCTCAVPDAWCVDVVHGTWSWHVTRNLDRHPFSCCQCKQAVDGTGSAHSRTALGSYTSALNHIDCFNGHKVHAPAAVSQNTEQRCCAENATRRSDTPHTLRL